MAKLSPTDIGPGTTARNAALALGLLLLAVTKLVLIGGHEIVAADRPHDDLWQILSAADWYWGRPFDQWTLMHPPIYPLFVAATGATGLPLRISIELIYFAGAATLSLALGRLGVPRVFQLAAFALIVFHPDSFNGFDFALTDTLYACLMLFFVALLIRVLTARNSRDFHTNVILFAAVTALLWHCRKESILIAALLGFAAILIATALVFKAVTRRQALRLALAVVAAPLVAIAALGAIISTANGRTYGFWHTDQFAAPNYRRAYASLQSIRPEHAIRFVPVTRETRMRAYAVSPAFRELQPVLDGEQENWGAYETRTQLGLEGEIGAGWFYWTLIDAAARTGHYKSAGEAEDFFGRMADEVSAALADGRLPSRRVILPYVDPNVGLWLPHVPHATRVLARLLFPAAPYDFSARPSHVNPTAIAAFDAVANRRAAVAKPPSYRVQGWTLSTGPRPTSIAVVQADGRPVQASFEPQPRPDVRVPPDAAGLPGPPALGFVLDWPAAALGLDSLRYKITLEGGKAALSDPIAALPLAQPVILPSTDSGTPVVLAIDRIEPPRDMERRAVTKDIAAWYPNALGIVALAGVLALVFARSAGGRVPLWQSLAVLLFVLAVIAERVLFFAVLDASAWSADQARYLFPVAILVVVAPTILSALRPAPSATDNSTSTERSLIVDMP